jgi:succinate dehydrogenase/fumarate reductase flavoprotein subunit
MGALRPWNLLILLFCLLVVAGGAAGLVALIRAAAKK